MVPLSWGLAQSNNSISAYLMSKLNPSQFVQLLHDYGVAQIFDGERLVASANALIDSSISISVSTEDLRAGTGAKL